QVQPDLYVHDYLGLGGKPAMRVNTGGATGAAAIRAGFMEIASGQSDINLVLGVEKCSDCYDYNVGSATPEALKSISFTADMTYEQPTGRTAAASFALATIAHQKKYGNPTAEQMAMVSVKNHANAAKNPIAQSGKTLTMKEVLESPMIAYPFRFYDNCLYSEGSSAVILASEEKARQLCKNPVWIDGVGASLDYAIMGNRDNLYTFEASKLATKRAYKMAGITKPREELDLAEMHDAFTATEILAYQDCFICEEGEGGKLIEKGVTQPDGDFPVNLSGGLIGCGHAVGATGIMQTIEIALQLQGRATGRQLDDPRRGMIQNIGGIGCAWTVSFVLSKDGYNV
ncbi:MAG TPA: thiolase family protein, partial [Bdellovibrionales bacterium]|nr:thiolase family protein [Bdellovibrionales bacterium]